MNLTAHQPVYLPWLGLFHKIHLTDFFCYFDIAQYQHKDFNNRNLIKTDKGPIWLSVPVQSKNHFEKKIKDIKIINNGWNKKHFKSILYAYKNAKFFDDYIIGIEEILIKKKFKYLSDLNLEFIKFGIDILNIKTKIIKASDYNFEGKKSALVLDMCLKLNANKYLFGAQGKNYADNNQFILNKVKPYYQKYNHPIYSQLHGDFLNNMSFIDLIFNEGPRARQILLSNNINELK
tara:strand:+ start:153 stop:854 length:702 start_codon:yes stop_codon:yes gene_type:complete